MGCQAITRKKWLWGMLLSFLLSGCYIKSGSEVKWLEINESGSGAIVLEGADPSTFRVLRHWSYAKDRSHAWFDGIGIEVADVSTFESVHSYYATDSLRAYYMRWPIDNSHGPSFKVIKGEWSKDRNDHHFRTRAIGVCDSVSFQIYRKDDLWGLDDECAYYMGKKLPLKERESFEILAGGFSKDRFTVYFEDKIVEGADSATFEMIGKTYVGRDQYRCYIFGKPTECPD